MINVKDLLVSRCTNTEKIYAMERQKLMFSSQFVPASWHRVLPRGFLGQPFSKDSFASKLSLPQPRDWGSLLTAGSETGALIQCLLNSVGLSRRQRMLDQGWRVWKILTRYSVWSQEIKLVEMGEGEKERKKSIPVKISLLCFAPTLGTTQNFSAFTTGCSWGNENLPCHTKNQANNYFSCLNTYDYMSSLFRWSLVISASALYF